MKNIIVTELPYLKIPNMNYGINVRPHGFLNNFNDTIMKDNLQYKYKDKTDKIDCDTKNESFKKGEYVWVTYWYYANIEPQFGKIKSIDLTGACIEIEKDHYGAKETWYFKEGEFRKLTVDERNKLSLLKSSDCLDNKSDDECDLDIDNPNVEDTIKATAKNVTENGIELHEKIEKYIKSGHEKPVSLFTILSLCETPLCNTSSSLIKEFEPSHREDPLKEPSVKIKQFNPSIK